MKIGAAYIRVSTEMQTELSPDSQLKAIRDYAQRNNIILSDENVYIDEGISGKKAEKRPEFMKMIAAAKSKPKPFDVILLWKFSRFARNREDSIVYKSMLRKQCGIDVVSISEQLSEDKTSILIEALLEAMDEYYSINLAEEVKRGMTEKATRGGIVSPPPFGYKADKEHFVPDEDTAPIVQDIFNKYLYGVSMAVIAKQLNEIGITTKAGNPFSNRMVKYILTNPVYIGKMRWNTSGKATATSMYIPTEDTIITDGGHEPIIDADIFSRVQQNIEKVSKMYPKHSRQAPADYMLKGLVRCSNCGATLTMSNGGLQCYRYMHSQCNVSHYISLSSINSSVINSIQNSLLNRNFNVKFDNNQPIKQNTELIMKLIEKERLKLEKVAIAYQNGIDTLEEYKLNKSRITNSIKELEERLNNETMPKAICAESYCKKVESVLCIINSNISESDKNTCLRTIIKKIIYNKKTGSLEVFYYA